MSTDREAGREEPKKRGAKSQYAEEMFERVRARVAEGMPVPTAIQAAGMCVTQFYAAVAGHPEWKVALQKARQERVVGRLEDESCRRVFIGDSRLVFWKGEQVGEIREPAIGMLIFMLKTLAPEKYANTKAAAKRREQLNGLEASRARVLANAQRGVKIMQGHYREYLQRCGVPVPCGGSDQSSVSKAPPCTHSASGASGGEDAKTGRGKSDQLSVNSNQSSVSEHTAAGQEGNLDHDLDHNLDLVPSGPASGTTPLGEDAESEGSNQSSVSSDQSSVSSDQSSVSSDQLPVNSDQSSVNRDQAPEAGQWGDFDPEFNSEPQLPPAFEPWWRPGLDVTVTMLEDEAYRLAIEGVLKPIFHQGIEVGERRVRSERLLKFLLISNAFEKYGRREVGPLQAEEEPGRPEFVAKLNEIYSQDEELHQRFTEVFERNNARRHAERIAELQRQNRGGKAPPWGEYTETEGSDQSSVISDQSSVISEQSSVNSNQSSVSEHTAAGQKGNLDHDLDHNLDLVPSGPVPSKAPPRTHGASGASGGEDAETGRHGDTETGRGKSEQLSVNSNQSTKEAQRGSNQSSANNEWDVLDFDQFSAEVAARSSAAASKAPPCGEDSETEGSEQLSVISNQSSREDTESKAPPCNLVKTPEYPKSEGQYPAHMTDNEPVTKHEDTAAGRRVGGEQSSVNSNQSSVSKAPPCTHGASGAEDAAKTAENQGSEPEHDAAWYSPSARAARITQSMIEHRLRKRRVEM